MLSFACVYAVCTVVIPTVYCLGVYCVPCTVVMLVVYRFGVYCVPCTVVMLTVYRFGVYCCNVYCLLYSWYPKGVLMNTLSPARFKRNGNVRVFELLHIPLAFL